MVSNKDNAVYIEKISSQEIGYKASATINLDGNPADGNTITLNGVTFTYRDTPDVANDVAVGADALESVTNLMAEALPTEANYTQNGTEIFIEYATIGVAGNDYTIDCDYVSGLPATLSGGSDTPDADWVKESATTVSFTPKEIVVETDSTSTALKTYTVVAENDKVILVNGDNSFDKVALGTVTDDGGTPPLYTATIDQAEAPSFAYFDNQVDVGVTVEANEARCLTLPSIYIPIDASTATDGTNIVTTSVLVEGERLVIDGESALLGAVTFNDPLYTAETPNHSNTVAPTRAYKLGQEVLTKESSTTTEFIGLCEGKKSGLISTGDVVVLDSIETPVTSITEDTGLVQLPQDKFETITYTGNGAARTISLNSITASIDFVWIKARSAAYDHELYDSIRGADNRLSPNLTNAEDALTDHLTAFGDGSFDLDVGVPVNETDTTFVAWCASLPTKNTNNTDGSITSSVMSNGFMSAVSFVGNATAGDTVGHGLALTPEMIIVKNRTNAGNFAVYNATLTATNVIYMTLDNVATDNDTFWNDTEPTSSAFTLSTNSDVNESGSDFIAYCFASVTDKCKVGSYTGTGATDNAIDCGFEPQWVLIKRTDDVGNWLLIDSLRTKNSRLFADVADAENTSIDSVEMTATGFNIIETSAYVNADQGNYIFLAIAKIGDVEVPRYTLGFDELSVAPTTGSVPSRDTELPLASQVFDGTVFTNTYGDLEKTGRAFQRKITASNSETTVTEPLTTQMYKGA